MTTEVKVTEADIEAATNLITDILGSGYASSQTNVSEVARYFAKVRLAERERVLKKVAERVRVLQPLCALAIESFSEGGYEGEGR